MCRFTVALLLCLFGQAFGPEPGRFGALGRALSPSDLDEIDVIATTAGGRPWLVLGHRSMIRGMAYIEVFLQPDVTRPQVSRGRMLALMADDVPDVERRSAWRLHQTKQYAYIGSPGRVPFDISMDGDRDWPFVIEGDITDSTLLALVAFIRSSPPIPGVPEGRMPRRVDAAPISVVARRAGTIIVGLRTGEYTGQRVTVVEENGQWKITDVDNWIV